MDVGHGTLDVRAIGPPVLSRSGPASAAATGWRARSCQLTSQAVGFSPHSQLDFPALAADAQIQVAEEPHDVKVADYHPQGHGQPDLKQRRADVQLAARHSHANPEDGPGQARRPQGAKA